MMKTALTFKEEEEEEKEKKGSAGRATELRLGISHNESEEMGGFLIKKRGAAADAGLGGKRWFSQTGETSESRPWRSQGKRADQYPSQTPTCRTPPAVGWPPLPTFRKNLGAQSQHTKMEMEIESEDTLTTDATTTTTTFPTLKSAPPAKSSQHMYVKVNMEGYAVGRKVDLKAHLGYNSLSLALQRMFNNFFTINLNAIGAPSSDEEGDKASDHVLIYEDYEGDRMLVGDVPWEMFINTVKRLYIISSSSSPKNS